MDSDSGGRQTLAVLRKLQAGIAECKGDVSGLGGNVVAIRYQLHIMQSCSLRRDRQLAAARAKLDQINAQLEKPEHPDG